MIKKKISHLGISLSYIAEVAETSRPTLYKFLKLYDEKKFNKISPKALILLKLIDEEMEDKMDWGDIHNYASPGELDGMLEYYEKVTVPEIQGKKDKILKKIKNLPGIDSVSEKDQVPIPDLANIIYSECGETIKLLQEINKLLQTMNIKDLEVIKDQIEIYIMLQNRKIKS